MLFKSNGGVTPDGSFRSASRISFGVGIAEGDIGRCSISRRERVEVSSLCLSFKIEEFPVLEASAGDAADLVGECFSKVLKKPRRLISAGIFPGLARNGLMSIGGSGVGLGFIGGIFLRSVYFEPSWVFS